MPQLELPAFEIKKYGPGTGAVTCCREGCGKTFVVHLTSFYKDRTYRDHKDRPYTITGRPCPYCFRASQLPPRSAIR